MTSLLKKTSIFGGDRPWSPLDWTSSDDRVRGGSSISELACNPLSPTAIFHGNLDTKTLGGAGFASQRTTGEDRNWDLSKYDGLVLDIAKSDEKKYTLTLKDELLPKMPNGRDQSTVSWEYDFKANPHGGKIFIQWDEFKPTYRGRDKKDAKPLDLQHVKRISFMMRSFFATQEGDFSLSINSLSAFSKHDKATGEQLHNGLKHRATSNSANGTSGGGTQGWFNWMFSSCSAPSSLWHHKHACAMTLVLPQVRLNLQSPTRTSQARITNLQTLLTSHYKSLNHNQYTDHEAGKHTMVVITNLYWARWMHYDIEHHHGPEGTTNNDYADDDHIIYPGFIVL
ncbi:uncharacterized protein L3040_003151 [Drepanopeziza brunnea f. sp. 'multigermtubi']|uniref:uncharacterized protein n=1 Tax=Drepanopeziza brunnea f. sp. 'multigermtubi' TaxID=698441 RepID=UPI00239A5DC3|nr:hypothetical protein L3040_003151 [Drepanopeziza brunnea f. sp. 'multigermtubi']